MRRGNGYLVLTACICYFAAVLAGAVCYLALSLFAHPPLVTSTTAPLLLADTRRILVVLLFGGAALAAPVGLILLALLVTFRQSIFGNFSAWASSLGIAFIALSGFLLFLSGSTSKYRVDWMIYGNIFVSVCLGTLIYIVLSSLMLTKGRT